MNPSGGSSTRSLITKKKMAKKTDLIGLGGQKTAMFFAFMQ